jgi:hypothetical protein
MKIIIILCISFLSIVFLYIIYARQDNKINDFETKYSDCNENENILQNRINDMQEEITKLNKMKIADEMIFQYTRCLNIPRSPSCKDGTICRSRQIDCNKYRLVLENDPIAMERIKIAISQ